jgi:fatty-acyl-CoA synthase
MVPTMFQMLAEHPDFARTDLGRVRWAISGGAPCPLPLRDAFAARGVRFKQGYGLTEAGVNCFAIDLDTAARKPWSVGRAILHTEAVVRRPDGTWRVRPGRGRRAHAGRPAPVRGYFEQPGGDRRDAAAAAGCGPATSRASTPTATWRWSAAARTCSSAAARTSTPPRSPRRSTTTRTSPPAPSPACPTRAGARSGWRPWCCARAHARRRRVRAFLKERLASYKVPKHVRFLDALPVSGAGKVLTRQLRDDFEGRADAAGATGDSGRPRGARRERLGGPPARRAGVRLRARVDDGPRPARPPCCSSTA